MKLSLIAAPCMALLLAAAPNLRADTVSVKIWEIPAFTNVPAPGSAVYSTPATFSGTVSNLSGSVFNFNSNGTTDYTITSFLTQGGDTVTGTLLGNSTPLDTPANCNTAGTPACVTDSLFEFSGPLNLTNAINIFNISHDDGIYVVNDATLGSPFCSIPAPTPDESSPCTIPAGNYAQVDIFYAEVDGNPAVLTTTLPLGAPTPEPSSIALLGTGLLAAAGLIRRRLFS